jgi:hypothetical protein
MSDEQQRALSGSFVLGLTLTDKRTIQMTGYVYSDDTPDQLNRRLDWFQDTMSRQLVRADITAKEAEIAKSDAAIVELAEHFDMLQQKKKKGSLSSQEKSNLDQYEASVRHWERTKESAAAAILAAKLKLNGSA